jgi:hypothetical protein
MKFKLRSDLVLLQKVSITGYVLEIPDGDYRIIDIQYDYADGGTTNEVTISVIQDSQFRAYLNLKRVYLNTVSEIQNIVADAMAQQPKPITGLLKTVSNFQPILLVVVAGVPIIVTGAVDSAASALNVGASGTINTVTPGSPLYTITFTVSGHTYTGTCPAANGALLAPSNTGVISAINAAVSMITADKGGGTSNTISGYTSDAYTIYNSNSILATPDSMGRYIMTPVY